MKAVLIAIALAVVVPSVAVADIAPEPGEEERWTAEAIQRAGIACPTVTGFRAYTGSDLQRLRARGYLRVRVAICGDGKRVLEARGPRRRGQLNLAPMYRVLPAAR